jgi:hypothetical protein
VESIGGDSGSVFPLRSPPKAACRFSVYVFLIYAAIASTKPPGSCIYYFLGQNKSVRKILIRIRRTRRKRPQVALSKGEGAPPGLFPSLLTSWCPTLSYFVRLKNSEAWPLTLPFLESRSSCNVKNTKKCRFLQSELEPEEGTLFRKSPKIS